MAKRKRRIRSPHPGVVLKRRELPSGNVSWRARFTEPETGREVYETLDASLTTREARAQWATRKAEDLARRRVAMSAGYVEPKTIEQAVADYLKHAEKVRRLRPKTLHTYGLALDNLKAWAPGARVRTTADLTPAKLQGLARHIEGMSRKTSAAGGKRGAKGASREPRSKVTVNREFRTLKTVLNVWRQDRLTPHLHRDDIRDAFKAREVDRTAPEFHRPAEIKKLLEAVLRHDAACFDMTRAERSGRAPIGSTTKHEPIAPFFAVLLLTGMRRGEALSLPWSAVDLDAVDHTGRVVGEIRLSAALTKTRRDRTVGLEVSPALRRILAAMRLQRGRAARVFGGYTPDMVETARRRLVSEYGAPEFTWQGLRSTCATYLTNARGIFGAATVYMSARQLGHSVAVAERHYLDQHRGIPEDARTLEAAMQVESELAKVLASVSGAASRAAS